MISLLAFGLPQGQELIIILLLVLIFFGAKRLPELARSLGKSIHEFRKAKDEFDRELNKPATELEVKESPEKQPHKTA